MGITKNELVKLMAEAARKPPLTGKGSGAYVRRQIEHALDALSAAGLAVVPKKTSNRMVAAANKVAAESLCTQFPASISASIAAGDLLRR